MLTFQQLAETPTIPVARRAEVGKGYATQQHDGSINSAGRGPVQSDLAPMTTKTYFAFRVDVWDSAANSVVEQIAVVDDFEVAEATFRAAVARWPAARITLRQGIRVLEAPEDRQRAGCASRSVHLPERWPVNCCLRCHGRVALRFWGSRPGCHR